MTEPDVTLTDYGLAAECAVFVLLLARGGGSGKQDLRLWFMVFFVTTALAAIVGGTVHGFFNDESTRSYEVLWRFTLLLIGLTGLSAWIIGAKVADAAWLRWIPLAAVAAFVAYCGFVVFESQQFAVAMAFYLPASVFLLAVLVVEYRRTGARPVLAGAAGVGLGFVAAGVQQMRIALHPVWFNHNALYHVIQAAALLLLFVAARWLVERETAGG